MCLYGCVIYGVVSTMWSLRLFPLWLWSPSLGLHCCSLHVVVTTVLASTVVVSTVMSSTVVPSTVVVSTVVPSIVVVSMCVGQSQMSRVFEASKVVVSYVVAVRLEARSIVRQRGWSPKLVLRLDVGSNDVCACAGASAGCGLQGCAQAVVQSVVGRRMAYIADGLLVVEYTVDVSLYGLVMLRER